MPTPACSGEPGRGRVASWVGWPPHVAIGADPAELGRIVAAHFDRLEAEAEPRPAKAVDLAATLRRCADAGGHTAEGVIAQWRYDESRIREVNPDTPGSPTRAFVQMPHEVCPGC